VLKSHFPADDELTYRNLYLNTTVHYSPTQKMTLHVCLLKGQGEPGYYPGGYFGDVQGGFFEQGSYYLLFTDLNRINKIIVGNYLPLFGQGLLFGGMGTLIMSNPYYDMARYRDGIYPSGSSSKNVLMEGVALEYVLGNATLRPFVSWNRFDCSAGESDYYKYCDNDCDGISNWDDEDDFTGMEGRFGSSYSCKTDLFSCIRGDADYAGETDRVKRNNLTEYAAGLNVSLHGSDMKGGWTLVYTRFNRLVDPYYDFDPDSGDKTGHFFRGRDYYSSNFYFRLYRPLEIFGEVAASYTRSLSYYPEFNGERRLAAAVSGGIRHKIKKTGLVLWGAYIPAHLINPHALELPDGCNNTACGLAGVHRSNRRRQFTGWLYLHSELFSEDDPGSREKGGELSYRLQIPAGSPTTVKIDQSFEATDNHYYAPGEMSYRLSSKGSLQRNLNDAASIIFRLENRTGGPSTERPVTGTGLSGELVFVGKGRKSSFSLMYFNTDDSRYAYLYPYDRALYRWTYAPRALHGRGLLSALTLVRELGELTLGTKARWNLGIDRETVGGLDLYAVSEYRF
jgi:hypothetical protein